MSAILSPPALHPSFAEDKGSKGITAASGPIIPCPTTGPTLTQALCQEVAGATQTPPWQSFSLPLHHVQCLETSLKPLQQACPSARTWSCHLPRV